MSARPERVPRNTGHVGFTPLPEERLRELIQAAQAGDFFSKEQLVKANTRLVHSIVRRFLLSGREADDLYQIGCIGLLKAIDKFDFNYDVCFSTYAVPLIMGEIRRYLRDDSPLTVSRSLKEKAQKLERKRRELCQLWGVEPELWQLAEACSMTEEEALVSLEAMRPPLSISAMRCHRDGESLGLDAELPREEDNFGEHLADKLSLQQYINQLPPRLAEIVYARYFEECTQNELSRRLGISQVQVSRLEKQALELMRRKMQADDTG